MNSSKPIHLYYTGYEVCDPGHTFGPAIRPNYLLHVVLSGKGTYEVNQQVFHLESGDCFLIHPNETTIYQADTVTPWKYAWVAFDGHEAKNILSQTGLSPALGNGYIYHPKDTNSFIESILHLTETAADPHANEHQLTGLFYLLFSHMYINTDPANQNNETFYHQKALNFIIRNYMNDIKIQDISKHIGIDRTYLYRIFMTTEHCSPKQYLMHFRLNAAMQMLALEKYSITEVAYYTGFRDSASFCNHFKKHANMTPKEYRKYLAFSI